MWQIGETGVSLCSRWLPSHISVCLIDWVHSDSDLILYYSAYVVCAEEFSVRAGLAGRCAFAKVLPSVFTLFKFLTVLSFSVLFFS